MDKKKFIVCIIMFIAISILLGGLLSRVLSTPVERPVIEEQNQAIEELKETLEDLHNKVDEVEESLIEIYEYLKERNRYENVVSRGGNLRGNFREMTVWATGYTAGPESTGKSPGHPLYGITRSGVKVHRGDISTIAADPSVLPLGSIVYVPGYGYGVVADTGSAIKGKKIDLYYETVSDVYSEWGSKNVTIQVIKIGTGKLTQEEFDEIVDAGIEGLGWSY